ncbi:MAG TPA: glycosyltransferase family 39 protein [Solirubrobacteraceae bacterium]|nr:glycosyltransferase family 39 protein [Solirubrobacteraceae bacterium]
MSIATRKRDGGAVRVPSGERRIQRLATISPEAWLAVCLTAVAALLRFGTLGAQSFWLDEATTVHEVSLPVGQMLHLISRYETTPPLYFLVTWVWTRVFGAGEVGIRSLSALAGTALVPVTYLCGRELVSRRAGLAAAALATLSPFLIWYSQEARSYMLFALLGGLSLLFWARHLRRESTAALTGWAVFSSLAILTHFFAVFLVAPEALWLLWRSRRRATVVAVVAVVVVQLAMVPLALGDTSGGLLSWLRLIPLSMRLQQIPTAFGASQLDLSPAVGWGPPGAAILLGLVVVLLAAGANRAERVGAARAGAVAAFVLLAPIALLILGRDYVFARNFIAAWVPLSVVVGAAVTGRRFRVLGAALFVSLIAGFVWASVKIDSNSAYQRPDWSAVAAALGPAHVTRAIVTYGGNAAEQPLSIYLPRSTFSYSGIPSQPVTSVSEVDVLADPLDQLSPQAHRVAQLIGTRVVAGVLVARFRLPSPWHGSPWSLAARAGPLLIDHPATRPAILIQRPGG